MPTAENSSYHCADKLSRGVAKHSNHPLFFALLRSLFTHIVKKIFNSVQNLNKIAYFCFDLWQGESRQINNQLSINLIM